MVVPVALTIGGNIGNLGLIGIVKNTHHTIRKRFSTVQQPVERYFLGNNAGGGATNAAFSNFLGNNAGQGATNADNANFFGQNAGVGAETASNANFLGQNAGYNATNAFDSLFFGQNAGANDTNAANSIFIGNTAGSLTADLALDNTAAYNDTSTFANTSILIGHKTSTGGFSRSRA